MQRLDVREYLYEVSDFLLREMYEATYSEEPVVLGSATIEMGLEMELYVLKGYTKVRVLHHGEIIYDESQTCPIVSFRLGNVQYRVTLE